MPAPKFSFSKIMPGGSGEFGYYVRISVVKFKGVTSVNMSMSKSSVLELGWDGKVIEFLADPSKNAIAFRFLDSLKKEEWNKKTMRMFKVNKAGNVAVGVTKILPAARIPVENYHCKLKTMHDNIFGDIYYFQPLKNGDDDE